MFRQVVLPFLMRYRRVHCAKDRFNFATQDLLGEQFGTAAAVSLPLCVPYKVLRNVLEFRRFGRSLDC